MAGLTGGSQMPPPPAPGAETSSASSFVADGGSDNAANPPAVRRFYRRRSRGACEACRGRRIRCDAMTLGVPCTNCTAFLIECVVLPGRAAKNSGKEEQEPKVHDSSRNKELESISDVPPPENTGSATAHERLHPMELLEQQLSRGAMDLDLYAKFMDPAFRHAPVDAGMVGYIAEHSNLALLVSEDTVHYPIPGNIKDSRTKLAKLGKEEVDLLRQRGALSIPHWKLCDCLIEAYFQYIAPILPIINRSRFMRQYRDPNNPPSLLLLQSMFLAGSRVISYSDIDERDGAAMPCSMVFYKRAKALYDSDYEEDRIITLQALILLGWYGEETGDLTKNVFYWNGLATTVAQGSGVHRNAEKARLPVSDKRLWKRLWWTLFTRDRSVAVGFGRPVQINSDDSDVAMISEEDFLDDEEGFVTEYRPDPLHVQFFIQYVSLCRIMSLILLHEHSTAVRSSQHNSDTLKQCDRALIEWVQNCPQEIKWDPSRYNFWAAVLHCAYYVTVGLRHRAYLPMLPSEKGLQKIRSISEDTHPLPFIAFQAACEITSASESMTKADQMQFAPAFMIYALASAINIHIYQIQSESSSIDRMTQKHIQACMNALKKISEVWTVAKVLFNRFEIILCDNGFHRNPQGLLTLAMRSHGAEQPTNRSAGSQYDPQMTDHYGSQATLLQFRDRLRQVVPNPTLGLFIHDKAPTTTMASSAIQTVDLLNSGGSAGYNDTESEQINSYSVSIPPEVTINSSFDPQMSLLGAKQESRRYNYHQTFEEYVDNIPEISTGLGTNGVDFP